MELSPIMPISNQAAGSASVLQKAQRLDGEERVTDKPSTSAQPLQLKGDDIVRHSTKVESESKQLTQQIAKSLGLSALAEDFNYYFQGVG